MIFNDNSMYYKEYGNGEPLLLIAGLASDSQSWLSVIDSLSEHFRVIIFDNRGVGRSPEDNSQITIEKMTDDTVNLIKSLKLEKVNILGHSMGGMIAMDLAIRYPELVDRLILEATSPKINNRNINLFNDWVLYLKSNMDKGLWFKNMFYWIFTPVFFNNTTMLKQAIEMSVDYPYPQTNISFENQINAVANYNCTAEMSKIISKTLVMFGELDLIFPPLENYVHFADIANTQSVIVPRAAHSIHIDNPDYFTKTVISFLFDSE